MRRRPKPCDKIPLFIDEDKVERIKLSYCLHRCIRAGRSKSKTIYDCDKKGKQESAFSKLANKLDTLSVDDVEGYIGSAFRLFDPVYPNMLLSTAVEKHFFATIDGRLRTLAASLVSAYNNVLVKCYYYSQLMGAPVTATILARKAAEVNPLFLTWYCYIQGFKDIPKELVQRAKITYYLWPLGYYQIKPWRVILQELGWIE